MFESGTGRWCRITGMAIPFSPPTTRKYKYLASSCREESIGPSSGTHFAERLLGYSLNQSWETLVDTTAYAVTYRIVWCRRQRARACSEVERDAWRAEEDGLRDAVLHRDHVDKYRSYSPNVLERYLLGFQDAKTLLRTTRAARSGHALGNKTHCQISSGRIPMDRALSDSADHLTYDSNLSG